MDERIAEILAMLIGKQLGVKVKIRLEDIDENPDCLRGIAAGMHGISGEGA